MEEGRSSDRTEAVAAFLPFSSVPFRTRRASFQHCLSVGAARHILRA